MSVKCRWCEADATRKRGRTPLCRIHFRFVTMRESCVRRQTKVPTMERLEEIAKEVGMTCPICKREMNWTRAERADTVLTLQHDRDGEMTFLCMSCNSRHYAYNGDDFYEVGPDLKRCPVCQTIKPLEEFGNDSSKRWGGKTNRCKVCVGVLHKKWQEENRDKYNAYMREYKRRRRAAAR